MSPLRNTALGASQPATALGRCTNCQAASPTPGAAWQRPISTMTVHMLPTRAGTAGSTPALGFLLQRGAAGWWHKGDGLYPHHTGRCCVRTSLPALQTTAYCDYPYTPLACLVPLARSASRSWHPTVFAQGVPQQQHVHSPHRQHWFNGSSTCRTKRVPAQARSAQGPTGEPRQRAHHTISGNIHSSHVAERHNHKQ